MVAFTDEHGGRYGVKSICSVLPIAPSAYRRRKLLGRDPSRRCVRTQRDQELAQDIHRVFDDNFGVYSACKVWHQLRREGASAARCTVERLMHPIVPFITETLWERLGEIAPERGVLAKLEGVDGLLVRAKWPEADAATWRDEALEARIAFGQEIVTNLREVRARYGVVPSQKVPVRIQAAGESGTKLTGLESLIQGMAGAESVEIAATVEPSKDAATAVVHDVECHVLGVVDLEQEKQKVAKERDGLTKRVEGSRRKLQSEGFVAKAPPAVVEKEKAKLADMEQQLARLEARLAEL